MEPFSFFTLAFTIVPVVLDTIGLLASFRCQTNWVTAGNADLTGDYPR